MQKQKKSSTAPSVITILAEIDQGVKKFSKTERMSKNEIEDLLRLVKHQCENSVRIIGYDENIIGYDANTNGIIYDGTAMIEQMADSFIQSDIDEGIEIDERWEYYEQAVEYFDYNISRSIDYMPVSTEKPKPIILMRFDD